MSTSQQVAAAVALRRLGYHVVAKPDGVVVERRRARARTRSGKLQPTDVIVSVDGTADADDREAPRSVLADVKIGASVTLGVRRGTQRLTVPDPDDRRPGQTRSGRSSASARTSPRSIDLPLRVSIDAGNVGGPSAGLAFALEVMEELGRNVDHGYRVAATGQMQLNGTVGPIGGVKQKTIGAREAEARTSSSCRPGRTRRRRDATRTVCGSFL